VGGAKREINREEQEHKNQRQHTLPSGGVRKGKKKEVSRTGGDMWSPMSGVKGEGRLGKAAVGCGLP